MSDTCPWELFVGNKDDNNARARRACGAYMHCALTDHLPDACDFLVMSTAALHPVSVLLLFFACVLFVRAFDRSRHLSALRPWLSLLCGRG